jgi:hypothetical protein
MRWENIRNFFLNDSESAMTDEVKDIEPRPLTEREAGWVHDILHANDEWRTADISRTQVVAEGPIDEGVSIRLQAPEPENPKARPVESVGQLWIQTDDGSTINVQLSQFEGRLRELYVLFIDKKHPKRKLPESWIEVSREAVNM